MKNLSSLLEKLVGVLHSDTNLKEVIKESIKECVGGSLKDSDILVKNGSLSISASPALKSEIRLKEDRILDCIQNKSGKRLQRIVFI